MLSSLSFLLSCAAVVLPVDPQASVTDQAYRIDLQSVDVQLSLTPGAQEVQGVATLEFVMRAGQSRPLFHFDPWVDTKSERDALLGVRLDGVEIDPAELRLVQTQGSDQLAWELPVDVDSGRHTLVVEYAIWDWLSEEEPGWLRTTVDDTAGLGNEVLWPTINAPGEQALHHIQIRVSGGDDYVAVGSSEITVYTEGQEQVFDLETDREVSSIAVMFAVMPAADVRVTEFVVGGVPVRMVSTESARVDAEARELTEQTLEALVQDFGAFPAPAMGILLLDWEDGMEYYGATTTGLSSLSHELTHMYWGTSAVMSTWRDTWMDEAITVWWDQGAEPIRGRYRSDMVSGRSEIETGFDQRGYTRGAQMFESVSRDLGEQQLLASLGELHQERASEPFTTQQMVDDLVEYSGEASWQQRFDAWVFGGGCSSRGRGSTPWSLGLVVGLSLACRRRTRAG